MNCELCGKDPESIALIPKRKSDGSYSSFACVECAKESGLFCETHNKPHMGFDDETSACIECIEQIVAEKGEKIGASFSVTVEESDAKTHIQQVVNEYLDGVEAGFGRTTLADIPLAIRILQTKQAQNVARPIICYSLRKKIRLEEGVLEAVQNPEKVFLGVRVGESSTD